MPNSKRERGLKEKKEKSATLQMRKMEQKANKERVHNAKGKKTFTDHHSRKSGW
ncbi:MAG TPA: hypothetical protein PLY04_03830 [bacterium]|nr:hypothetical protein [bacterium]HPM96398.1 hypothetical protein [bacterium]